MIIIVTGTPCTGKTTYAKTLAQEKSFSYIDVNEIIKKHNLSEGYDEKAHCEIIDTDKLNDKLIEIIKMANRSRKSLVIDSHLSHYLPSKYVDKCIVMRCTDLKELKKRLEKRGYDKLKVEENIEAEIMESCLQDALQQSHKVEVIDTSEEI